MSRLVGPFAVRALADRDQIDRFLIRRLARRFRVLPIPDLDRAGAGSADEIRRMVEACVEALRKGDNLILYPAGRLLTQRETEIRGNSAVESIVHELPEVRVVLVRTSGLWGSRFSWARGVEPQVAPTLWKGAKSLLASGVFFAPRRVVDIELVEPDDFPREADRTTINGYLEAFHNAGATPNTYVPYTVWERGGVRELPEPAPPHIEGDPSGVPATTREIVTETLAETLGTRDFADDTELARDLGMDSLARMELISWLQSEFGFPAGDTESLRTVGDVMLAAAGEAVSTGPKSLKPVPGKWLTGASEPGVPDDLPDMTLTEAFLHQAKRTPGAVIAADQTSGVKTYRDLVLGAMVLKRKIETLPGERLGVMMPASVAADVMVLATLFAGKTPAMINWTLGRTNLEHCMKLVGVERILTSRQLVSRLEGQGVDLEAVNDCFVFIEQVAEEVSPVAKAWAWLRSRLSWRALRTAAAPDPAVILFTSGSENLPKAVPLSHRNILTNVRDACETFTMKREHRILGILPPFHSFGLTTSVFLPVATGLRVVHYPNPTDGAALGRMIGAYGATILIGTPTFLGGVLRGSTDAQLEPLRLVVTGAEKCPDRVYDALARKAPQTIVMEGYGVTECSPIISCNREDDARPGTIGRVMRSLDHVLVDPEDGEKRVEAGETGMLLVRGPSVFDGYMNYDGASPFVTFDGEGWYRTGDLVVEDPGGVLSFAGRLKRFIKLGGEMISLPAIEAALAPHYESDDDEGPVIAVTATPDEEKPEIVLFTTRGIEREEANTHIREAGLSGLHNVRRVVRLDALPQLGTGKTDYRALTDRLKSR
jgi:long-chain-fatty-acid--[acyl-carrier-protein] ligase